MSSFRLVPFVLAALVMTAPSVSQAGDKGKKPFSISKETTRITEPLDKDGFPDYVAALNDRLAAGVTRENNALVLLCQAFGPKPEGNRLDPEFYKRLGIDEPTEKGTYFVRLERFVDADKLGFEDRSRLERAQEELTRSPWKTADNPQIAAWLKAMETPLAVGMDASRRSGFFHPMIPAKAGPVRDSLVACSVVHVQQCGRLGEALALRAMLHLGEGRSDAAWQDLLACYRLGRLTSQSGSTIAGLEALTLERMASGGTLAILEHGRPEGKRLRRCWNDWRTLPALKPVRTSMDSERFTMLEMALLMQRYGPSVFDNLAGANKPLKPAPMKGIAWDPALTKINNIFDRFEAALNEAEYPTRRDALRKLDLHLKTTRAKDGIDLDNIGGAFATPSQRGERLGTFLIGVFMPAITKVQEAHERTTQIQRNTNTAFALAAYRLDHGVYPKALAALVPTYLDKAPVDLFTGKPPVYRPQADGYLLYSFGLNAQDDNARSRDDELSGDDIVVRMPRRPQPK